MENIKFPAHPTIVQIDGIQRYAYGLTKLEIASLMIAQGILSNSASQFTIQTDGIKISKICVTFAKEVLEEANK